MLGGTQFFPRVEPLKLVNICFGIFRLLGTECFSTNETDSVIHPTIADTLSTIQLIIVLDKKFEWLVPYRNKKTFWHIL